MKSIPTHQCTRDGGNPEHWRDTRFRIEEPVVAQLQAAFNDNWIKTTGQVLNGPSYFPPLQEEGEMEGHVFVASPSGGSESMQLMYLLAISAAEPYSLARWKSRPLREKFSEKILLPTRSQL